MRGDVKGNAVVPHRGAHQVGQPEVRETLDLPTVKWKVCLTGTHTLPRTVSEFILLGRSVLKQASLLTKTKNW